MPVASRRIGGPICARRPVSGHNRQTRKRSSASILTTRSDPSARNSGPWASSSIRRSSPPRTGTERSPGRHPPRGQKRMRAPSATSPFAFDRVVRSLVGEHDPVAGARLHDGDLSHARFGREVSSVCPSGGDPRGAKALTDPPGGDPSPSSGGGLEEAVRSDPAASPAATRATAAITDAPSEEEPMREEAGGGAPPPSSRFRSSRESPAPERDRLRRDRRPGPHRGGGCRRPRARSRRRVPIPRILGEASIHEPAERGRDRGLSDSIGSGSS